MRRLDQKTSVSGQVDPADIPNLAAQGVTMIVNNRPDDEDPGQPTSAEVERAAAAAGIAYRHVPVGSGGLSAHQVGAMAEALEATEGQVLAYCRVGLRSAYLWGLARAQAGEPAEAIMRSAAEAGYDLTPIRPYLG